MVTNGQDLWRQIRSGQVDRSHARVSKRLHRFVEPAPDDRTELVVEIPSCEKYRAMLENLSERARMY